MVEEQASRLVKGIRRIFRHKECAEIEFMPVSVNACVCMHNDMLERQDLCTQFASAPDAYAGASSAVDLVGAPYTWRRVMREDVVNDMRVAFS